MNTYEIWKLFDDNIYVSNLGRVFDFYSKEFLKPSIHRSRSNFYLRISINKKRYMLHVLVANVFIKNEDNTKNQVDHIDGNTLNPRADNLQFVTESENKLLMHSRRLVVLESGTYKGTNKKPKTKKKIHRH